MSSTERATVTIQLVTLDRTTVCADCGEVLETGCSGLLFTKSDPMFAPWFRCQRCVDRKGFSRWFMFRHDGHQR